MGGKGHEQYMRMLNLDKNKVKQLVSRAMWVLVKVLVEYGSNDNMVRVWEKINWMVCHFDSKHLHQKLLPPIFQA